MRAENRLGETALHDAVRVGSRGMVIRLMEEDPELASFPREGGASPLYLAVVMEEVAIARSLHDMSHGSLSYAGPNGQNALHAAVLRGKGTPTLSCIDLFVCNHNHAWFLLTSLS